MIRDAVALAQLQIIRVLLHNRVITLNCVQENGGLLAHIYSV